MSEKNIQVAKDIYAAFTRGDVPGIMQHLSDDLLGFGILTEKPLIPWHVQAHRKQDVPRFFQAIGESAEVTNFKSQHFAAGGDHVYCTVGFDVKFKNSGQRLSVANSLQRFTFKDGKVVEWRGSEDTARMSAAYNAVSA
jgi:ketosteroid isomerase-like protein